MVGLAITLTLLLPLGMALISPAVLVYGALLTGALPLSVGSEGIEAGGFGRFDLYAIRLMGLWLACFLVVLSSLGSVWAYCLRNKFHLAFLLFCALGVAWSPSYTYGLRMWAKLSAPFLFLLVMSLVMRAPKQLHRLENVILGSGVVVALVAAGSFLGGWRTEGIVAIGIPGLGPSATSLNLAIIAVVAFAGGRISGPHWKTGLALCLGLAVIACNTRISIGGMFVGASLVMLFASSGVWRIMLPAAGLLGFPALFLLNDTFKERMFKGSSDISVDMVLSQPVEAIGRIHGSGRFDVWQQMLDLFFASNPIIGSGTGTTQHYFYTHTAGLQVIHSEFVRILIETGVVGLGLLICALFAYGYRLSRIYRHANAPETKRFALAALGGLVVYVLFMATDNAIDYVGPGGLFVFALIGMAEKAREMEQASVELQERAEPLIPEYASAGSRAAVDSNRPRRYPLLVWEDR